MNSNRKTRRDQHKFTGGGPSDGVIAAVKFPSRVRCKESLSPREVSEAQDWQRGDTV